MTGGQGDEAIGDAERWAEEVICDAEASRARMINVQGLFPNSSNNELVHTALVNQNYFMVVCHVDDMTCRRIVNNQYVDFAQLLPRDRILEVEENRMELVNRNSQAFYVPAGDRDASNYLINSFN